MAENTKYLVFRTVDSETTRKTKIVHVINKSSNTLIAEIRWHSPWRQYCFYPFGHTIWNKDCLEAVNLKIDELMRERRRHG